MRLRKLPLIPISVVAIACSGRESGDLASKTTTTLNVSSEAFQSGQAIPDQYTPQGGNRSPAISWTTVPAESKSIAMIVDDPDANGYVHWVIFNLPPSITMLPAGLPPTGKLPSLANALQGQNSHGEPSYFGPQPPPGKPHHYHFHVYALDEMLPLKAGASRDEVVKAMSHHVLAQGEIIGTYQSG